MDTYNLNILGLSETHWGNKGNFETTADNTVYFLGPDDAVANGVVIVPPVKLSGSVIGCNAIDGQNGYLENI